MFQLSKTFQLSEVAHALAWSPNGECCAFGCRDGSVQLCYLGNEDRIPVLEMHGESDLGEVSAVSWSPNGRWIAASGSSGAQGKVVVWEASTGQLWQVYTGHEWLVVDLAWSPDSHCIASASLDASVQVWDAESGRQWYTYEGHEAEVESVAWSPGGQMIASGDMLSCIHLWNPVTGQRLLTFEEHMTERSFGDGAEGISALAFEPVGSRIASAQVFMDEQGGRLLIWDTLSGHTSLAFQGEAGHPGWMTNGLSWTHRGTVVGATLDGSVHHIHPAGNVHRVLYDPEMGYAAKLAPAGTMFVSSVRTEPRAKLWAM